MSKNWAGMIRPAALEVDTESLKGNYGKFTAKPLERGYGLTLGNSLRRVRICRAPGAARRSQSACGACRTFRGRPPLHTRPGGPRA